MKRKIFFWLEKLKITRQERITIASLLVLLVIMSVLNFVIEPGTAANAEHYEAIREEFNRRKADIEQKERELLKRYSPQPKVAKPADSNGMIIAVSDTITRSSESDTLEQKSPQKINVNTASLEKLQELKGIGPVYAKRIVAYRDTAGRFEEAEELIRIKGIGEKRLENIKPMIAL
ncbi:helix-hairpin-helix domain-containing protein [Aliifodinibius sp. S!AR15-10]|uniref:ComEA family DNA-binding protein n=1 Tax=Aliifodinibius sp. S!AR15-10 TaxID=2950437 RepID=UPI0028590B8F|nr:helix-hairpin-helix domain-containing protein [Aliifodinibius sp. S!AR15-10]MDR8394156.1 helix-hairpin-helix domain-containing protein [Aliifodinibius sp. S!AR15-10]